jgi:hypothetical protein
MLTAFPIPVETPVARKEVSSASINVFFLVILDLVHHVISQEENSHVIVELQRQESDAAIKTLDLVAVVNALKLCFVVSISALQNAMMAFVSNAKFKLIALATVERNSKEEPVERKTTPAIKSVERNLTVKTTLVRTYVMLENVNLVNILQRRCRLAAVEE